jgi:hypothetical protein
MPVGVTGKKPAKKFPVLEAATCPLVGEQKVILRGLQLRLLDIEAAMTKDMLEPARSSPVRRRAWRFLVKSTTCIYQVTFQSQSCESSSVECYVWILLKIK